MPTQDIRQNLPKHTTKFWPLFLVVIIAAVLAGVVYLFSYNSQIQDETNSLYFWKHAQNTQVRK